MNTRKTKENRTTTGRIDKRKKTVNKIESKKRHLFKKSQNISEQVISKQQPQACKYKQPYTWAKNNKGNKLQKGKQSISSLVFLYFVGPRPLLFPSHLQQQKQPKIQQFISSIFFCLPTPPLFYPFLLITKRKQWQQQESKTTIHMNNNNNKRNSNANNKIAIKNTKKKLNSLSHHSCAVILWRLTSPPPPTEKHDHNNHRTIHMNNKNNNYKNKCS